MSSRLDLLALWTCMAIAAGCGDSPRSNTQVDAAPPIDAPAVAPTRVALDDGEVDGTIVGSSRQFLGIPYAKPPIGALRWKPPQKPDRWTTPLQATAFGKRCAQLASATLGNAASNDEDCLYLNVWTPSLVSQTPLPVMVWIHGGGNVNGSASEPVPLLDTGVFYSGQSLAGEHGVIVVTLNYRLGLFGFFSHPDLAAEGGAGNQGLLDQRMAMQWVRDNIARFGGDPNNVTIFGESAGAQDVCLHMASSGSAGLFHRAIAQSGGCTTRLASKVQSESLAVTVASDLGCSDPGALACLRARSAGDLMASEPVIRRLNDNDNRFGPGIDGQFIVEQPRLLFDMKKNTKVPFLAGSNTDEGTLFVPGTIAEADYMPRLVARFGTTGDFSADKVAAQYPLSEFMNAMPNQFHAAFARIVGDMNLVCSTLDSALRAEASGAAVYLYNFDIAVPPELTPGRFLGATHGAELTFVFGSSPTFALDATAKAASDQIQRYWTNFARTGDPNGGSDPAWPKLTQGQNIRANLALQVTTVTDFRKPQCDFWRKFYATRFPAGL